MHNLETVVQKVKDTLIKASTSFREDQKQAYRDAILAETDLHAKWVLERLLENALVAEQKKSPLCDDTGIVHLFLEVGKHKQLSGELLSAISEGVAEGLRALPGRPMAIKGNDIQRIDQSGGLNDDPGALLPSPILLKQVDEDILKLHIIMQGGGPAIQGKTYRVFHKHDAGVVVDEIVNWGTDAIKKLGCTPSVLTVGIGRSQFEAASMMMEAQVYGRFDVQNRMEQEITRRVNESRIGALGLKGDVSVLATFVKVGPQRASGVRIVCLRPCCCFEPRIASVLL